MEMDSEGGAVMKALFFEAKAPSNIALVKYMGKTNVAQNAATNSSLSWTLPHLLTTVTVGELASGPTRWEALDGSIQLSETGLRKFLGHWERCRKALAPHYQKEVLIRSGNNFPSDCGLASSASSFAALTLAAYGFFKEAQVLEGDWTQSTLAQLSRQGSGSSCRSLFDGWVLWSDEKVESVDSCWSSLLHSVVVADETPKKVSSSEAHIRVQSSALFKGRIERAEKRAQDLRTLLNNKDSWRALFELGWSEFWDMHALFETSHPPFYYMVPQSLAALRYVQGEWEKKGDGPLVTMDAGPNVHLLYRTDQGDLQKTQRDHLNKLGLRVICSQGGA